MKIDVKSSREVTGLTNGQLAKKIGCSSQWLTNASVNCKPTRTDVYIIKLSEVTGITIKDLCINTDDEEEAGKRVVVLEWIQKNIDNCKTPEQEENAKKLLKLYKNTIK